MFREDKLHEEDIMRLLVSNAINRNGTINNFIKMLNSINSSANLSVDGPWGTGKTIFVKQLEFLSRTNKLDTAEFESILFTGIEKSNIINFQKNYIVYYYNAWQNDNHIDRSEERRVGKEC